MRVLKILKKFSWFDFNFYEKDESLFLEITLPTDKSLNELKRRLGNKRDRKGTVVEIIEFKKDGK